MSHDAIDAGIAASSRPAVIGLASVSQQGSPPSGLPSRVQERPVHQLPSVQQRGPRPLGEFVPAGAGVEPG